MNLSVVKALSDEALAALASKGLLRRAQKDLERERPEVREDTPERVVLDFPGEGCAVTIPAIGPRAATCTCPAGGICRHILGAVLFLRDYEVGDGVVGATAEESDAPGPGEEIMALGEAELVGWAGRQLYRQALDDLGGVAEGEIEEGRQVVTIVLPQLNATARWVAGTGLDGMICSCKQPGPCRHRIAAILVYQAAHGRPLPAREERVLQAAAGAPVTRAKLLASVRDAIVDLAANGFGRLSRAAEGRLRTLAVSAHGVDLPRLERTLRALADAVLWHVQRDVRADAARTLDSAARAYALARALDALGAQAPADLVGEHRSQFYPAGTLELAGVGAQQWRTHSGFLGLVLFFWDTRGRRWASWTDARADFYGAPFEPRRAYRQGNVWGDTTPEAMSRSRLRLSNARRARDGRLGSPMDSQALVLAPTDPAALDLGGVRFDDWSALNGHLAARRAAGLRTAGMHDSLVVLVPTAWGDATYDQARQALVRPLRDAGGRSLPLVLQHDKGWPFALDTLQTWEPERHSTWGVLGRAMLGRQGLEVVPITLFSRGMSGDGRAPRIVNLTLDAPDLSVQTEFSGMPDIGHLAPPDDEDLGEEDTLDASPELPIGALGQLLASASSELEQLAERGCAGPGAAVEERIGALAERSRQLGLAVCAESLKALATALTAARHSPNPDPRIAAGALLHAYYVVRLCAEELAASAVLA